MKHLLVLFLLLLLFTNRSLSQSFSKEHILNDLEFLKTSLEETHYNLYAYTDKETFSKNYFNIKQSIAKDSLSLLEATSLFQQVISKANTGHAEIDFPATSYRKYAMNGGTIFPLEIAIQNNKSIIRKNFSNIKALNPGLEILSIDGIAIQNILNKMYSQLSAETTYFKHAKLELWTFPRLYWQVYGEKKHFKITVKAKAFIKDYTINAIDLVNDFELKRTDIISANPFLKYYDQTAYIKPGNFSGDEENFKHFIDSAFIDIKVKKSKALIIDLRNNLGGHNAFSDYLVSYFASEPFKWHSKFTLKTSAILKRQTRKNNDTLDVYFKNILEHKNGDYYPYIFDHYKPQLPKKRFTGEVYVLINRHSYSMAAVTAAMIQDYKFATIVGEETGDFPSLYASQFQYTLPNSGIVVKVPKGRIIRSNGNEDLKGVVPDILIKDYLVDESDEILNALLKRIN